MAILREANQHIGKHDYVRALDRRATVCVGNGRNDWLMLKEAALGIAIVEGEGAAVEAVCAPTSWCRASLRRSVRSRTPSDFLATLRS